MDRAGRPGLARPTDPRLVAPNRLRPGCVGRRVRRVLPFVILAGCLVVGVLPALAADGSVTIRDFSFTPSRIAVKPGESVTWHGSGTTYNHNVHFDGEPTPLGPPSTSFTATRDFPTQGEYRYFCDVHGSMTGTVFVNSTGTVPAPTATASPTTSPTASPTASPAPGATAPAVTPAPTVSGGATRTVTSFRVRRARSRFCTTRSARCKRPGVFLLVDLGASEPVRLRGTLTRSGKRVRAVSIRVRPGSRRVRLPGAPLKPGRYALTLRAGDLTRRVRFSVRPA